MSLSSPKLLNTERAKNEDGFAAVATDRMHCYLSGGYNFELSNSIDLLPSVMVRYVNGAPFSTDFTATTIINDVFNLGATYRTDSTIAGMATFELNQHLIFGFTYEVSSKKELASARNTNELLLKYKF